MDCLAYLPTYLPIPHSLLRMGGTHLPMGLDWTGLDFSAWDIIHLTQPNPTQPTTLLTHAVHWVFVSIYHILFRCIYTTYDGSGHSLHITSISTTYIPYQN